MLGFVYKYSKYIELNKQTFSSFYLKYMYSNPYIYTSIVLIFGRQNIIMFILINF